METLAPTPTPDPTPTPAPFEFQLTLPPSMAARVGQAVEAARAPRGTGLLILAGAGICAVACLGKSLAGMPLVAQALQVLGLVYVAQLALQWRAPRPDAP